MQYEITVKKLDYNQNTVVANRIRLSGELVNLNEAGSVDRLELAIHHLVREFRKIELDNLEPVEFITINKHGNELL
jgi:hypothetical protein